ncbi:MAG: glycosyltransferase family 39 protein [Anaerolineae bacterium]|nr:glycosyltransferase family 39 protein [Anaerolineae bacterium]
MTRVAVPAWRGALADHRLQIALVLGLALLLRLGHVLLTERWPAIGGGDYSWYGDYGRDLVQTGKTLGPPPTGPIFLLVAGAAEHANPTPYPPGQALAHAERLDIIALAFPACADAVGGGAPTIRLLHTVLGTVIVWLAYRIGRAGWNHHVGLGAAFILAINPAFVLEAGNLTTETISFVLLLWALALWLERSDTPDWRLLAAMGSLLALAALTRSVFLAFPALPIAHLWLRHGWRKALRGGLVLLVTFLLTISPWTLYNFVTWDRLTLTGEGLLGMLYVGAVGWQDPEAVDAGLGINPTAPPEDDFSVRQEAYAQGFLAEVQRDPFGYVVRRAGELGAALLQPHNTTFYPGASIKELFADWLHDDRTLSGLIALTGTESFWPKLALYAFHYTGMLLGLIGLWLNRRRWRELWPLYAVFAYFLGIHLVLAAIPRYLFPLEPFWWLFGTTVLVALGQRVRSWWRHRREAVLNGPAR